MTFVEYGDKHNNKIPKSRVDKHVGTSKCENNFTSCFVPNWFEEILAIKKVNYTIPRISDHAYVIDIRYHTIDKFLEHSMK